LDELAAIPEEERTRLLDEFHKTPAYQQFLSKPMAYAVIIQPDGSFRADDVPPGSFVLNVEIRESDDGRNYHRVAAAEAKALLPETPTPRSGEPFNIGTIELKPYPPPASPDPH